MSAFKKLARFERDCQARRPHAARCETPGASARCRPPGQPGRADLDFPAGFATVAATSGAQECAHGQSANVAHVPHAPTRICRGNCSAQHSGPAPAPGVAHSISRSGTPRAAASPLSFSLKIAPVPRGRAPPCGSHLVRIL